MEKKQLIMQNMLYEKKFPSTSSNMKQICMCDIAMF